MTEAYIRPDGRGRKQLRDLSVEVGILDRAEGSSRVHLGKNIAIATVFGPREMHPKHAARSDRAVVRINYRMATFSVDGYKRSYPSRREKEISKVLSEAFESIVLTKNWPRSVVDVHIEIFQSDGGTRTAAAIAITAALADAGIPMRDLTGGIASGLYEDQVCLDLTGHEDMKGTGDMPILYSPSIDEISLFQLDGQFTFDQFKEAFYTSMEGIREIVAVIREALKEKYLKVREEFGVDEEDEDIEDYDEEEEDDEEEEEYDEEEDEEEEEELTPVPSEPVGEAHAVSTESVDTPVSEESEQEITPVPSEPVGEAHTVSTTEESSSDDEYDPLEDTSEIKNTWFNKPGGQLQPMPNSNTPEDDDNEEEETSSVMRDLEYAEEE